MLIQFPFFIFCSFSNYTIDYPASSLSTSACNVFNPAVDVNNITHQSRAGGVSFSSNDGLILSTIPSGQSAGGTAYVIQYNFTTGSNYTISITAIGNSSLYLKTAVVPNLNQFNTASTTSCTPDPNVTGYSTVGVGNISTTTSSTSTVYSSTQFTVPSTYGYLVIWATGGIVSQSLDALIISKVEIVKSASASFTLSPTTVNATCGTAISQTFTVTNGNNSPVTSYEWNLGSSSNGWLYNGNPAPQTISTTTNSVTLTSNGCSSLSTVSVTPKNNTTSYTTLTATVNMALPQFSISGKSVICNSETYTLNGSLPCNATVTRSLPSSAGSVLQFSPNPPTGTSVTLTNQKWYGVSTTLTATISNLGCSANPITVTKSIANDNDQSSSSTYSYSQESCNYYNVSHPANSGTITSTVLPGLFTRAVMFM